MGDVTNLRFEEQSGCLIIRVFGREIIEQMEATFEAMADAIKTRSPKATLVDLRAVRGPVTFMDKYQLGENTSRYLAPFVLAALATEEQTDSQRIGQQVARNRGANVEVFTDPAEAEAWLKKQAGPT